MAVVLGMDVKASGGGEEEGGPDAAVPRIPKRPQTNGGNHFGGLRTNTVDPSFGTRAQNGRELIDCRFDESLVLFSIL